MGYRGGRVIYSQKVLWDGNRKERRQRSFAGDARRVLKGMGLPIALWKRIRVC